MTVVDWVIVAFTVLLASWGYRQGLIVGALSLGGFAAGAVAGARLAPMLLEEGAESPYAPLMALIGALLLGGLVAILIEGFAHSVRARVVRGRAGHTADGVGGGILTAALALGLAWVFGAVALNTPGADDLRRDMQRSAILKRLNGVMPPSGPILNTLNRIDPVPRLDGPEAQVEAPPQGIGRDPQVQAAGNSVVKVLGTACGLGIEGSGWVAGENVVVTNAHVIAGQDDTTVTPRGGGSRLRAVPIVYDTHNDLAVLRVDLLTAPALEMVRQPETGTAAAILGFPENGPFDIQPARLGSTTTVLSQDSYGRGPIQRRMTSMRGTIRNGNSGGPAVDTRGRVLTTVFAATTGGERGGFGIPNEIVREGLEGAGGQVSTGPCAAR